MAPLPKRKHSTQRKGKRIASKHFALPQLVWDSAKKLWKLPHREAKS